MANPKQLQNARVSVEHINSSLAALHVVQLDSTGGIVSGGVGGGSTQVSIKEILSSSGGSLIDSSNVSLGVTIRAGSAAGTEYTQGDVDATISGGAVLLEGASDTLQPLQGSTNTPSTGSFGAWVREIPSTRVQTVDPAAGSTWAVRPLQSSQADLRATVYQSTAADLNVTVAGYSTIATVSTGSVRVHQSTAADLNVTVAGYSTIVSVSTGSVRVHQSTAADLNVTVAGYSTTVQVSSVAGAVIMRSSAADAIITVKNSTIGELLASVQQNSTVWQTQAKIQDSSGVSPNIVGTRPSTGAQGIAIRTILNDLQSTAFSTIGNGSTSSTIVSSVAGQRVKVYAYSITSTVQAVNTLTFASSLANPIWHIAMQAFSSGISGANLAVTPPAWLFATAAAEPLVFKVTGTTGSYHLSFSWFTEA